MSNDPLELKQYIRTVKNFPIDGITFRDITSLIETPKAFVKTCDSLTHVTKDFGADIVVSIESRGFIFAAPLAIKLGCQFVLARKPGKLPSKTISEEYELEYGKDAIEIHQDAIGPNDKVLIVDDLLATGGTAKATGSLVEKLGGKIVSYAFLIVLSGLNGKKLLSQKPIYQIIEY